jgi:predicted deacylase
MQRRDFLAGMAAARIQPKSFAIRPDYLAEAERIPEFWLSTVPEVQKFLESRIRKGTLTVFGKSAGGRPMRAVSYGQARGAKGTTTFSGSLGFRDVRVYLGPGHARKVYLGFASVHGGEFEGIVGMVNLLSVLETGRDLRGKDWPEITAVAQRLDRIVLIPITNVDGRARVPLRMIRHQGTDHNVHEYFNTGAKPDGTIIGWPQCKEFIPLDFAKTQFPGGYPNDAGVNIQHDDFLGARQPETQALFDLVARERPDLTMNMHTGAVFMHPLRPAIEPELWPRFDELYRRIMTRLTHEGLQRTDDPAAHSDPSRERMGGFNLESAINAHCGALAVLVESPSHNFSTAKKDGKPFLHTPENLLDAQLCCHLEAMKYLADTGGRVQWTAKSG